MKKLCKVLALLLTLVMVLTSFAPITALAADKEPEELTFVEIYDFQAPPAGALYSPIVGYKVKFQTSKGEVSGVEAKISSEWAYGLGYGYYTDVRTILGKTYFAYFDVQVIDSRYKITDNTRIGVNGDWSYLGKLWNYHRYVSSNSFTCMTNEKYTVTKGTYDGTTTWKPDKAFNNVTASAKEFTYNGKAQLPEFTVKDGQKVLENGKDYYITLMDSSGKEISEAVEKGKYTAVINGYGDYIGTESKVEFTIADKKKSVAVTPTVTLSKTAMTYTGKALKPAVTVKAKGKTLSKSDYTVQYKNNTKVGTATVTVTLKGNYSGKKSVTFKIIPKGTTIAKLTPASKAMTVKWKKQAAQTTGYQIQYATNAKFTKAKTVTVAKNSTVSKKITKLTGKKKYYIRVRTYKTVGKTKYYSTWSAVKNVTTKK